MEGLLRRVEPESDAVYGLQINVRIGLEVFAELGDEHVHAPAQEVVVFAPNVEQYLLPFQNAVGVFAKEFQEIGFLLREVEDFGADGELQIRIGEIELTDGEGYGFFRVHFPGPPEKHFHAHEQLLDTEGFGDIIVGPALETFDLVLFHGPGREKEDGDHIALLADLSGDGKPIFVGHHDIEQADRELVLVEFVDSGLAIGAQDYLITGVNQIILDDISQGKVVFSQ